MRVGKKRVDGKFGREWKIFLKIFKFLNELDYFVLFFYDLRLYFKKVVKCFIL